MSMRSDWPLALRENSHLHKPPASALLSSFTSHLPLAHYAPTTFNFFLDHVKLCPPLSLGSGGIFAQILSALLSCLKYHLRRHSSLTIMFSVASSKPPLGSLPCSFIEQTLTEFLLYPRYWFSVFIDFSSWHLTQSEMILVIYLFILVLHTIEWWLLEGRALDCLGHCWVCTT